MISPKLLETTMKLKHTDTENDKHVLSPKNLSVVSGGQSRQSSVRFTLNDIDISDGELTANEMETSKSNRSDFKIDDFFEGFDHEQINHILITPLEDAQVWSHSFCC